MLDLNKCYLVFALSMNTIRSCSLQYVYSFKSENNCCSVYMNKTFYGHTPNVNGLLNLIVVIHIFIIVSASSATLVGFGVLTTNLVEELMCL